MKKKISPLMKDTLRTIRDSLGRFLAIITMTGLSAMVFIGLQSVVPNLRETIVSRVKDHQMHDLKVFSYVGIRDEDKKILEDLPGNNQIEYMTKEVFTVKNDEISINLMTMTDSIDTGLVSKGRLPIAKDEILLDELYLEDFGDQIGKTVSFVNKNGSDDKKILQEETFTIVGYGKSIDYIGKSRSGSTNSGDYFGIVMDQALIKEYPDLALVRLVANKGWDISTLDFKHHELSNINKIKLDFEKRPEEVKQEILADAYKEIEDGKLKIADGKKEISDGQKELDDAYVELRDAKVELNKSKDKLESSKITIDDSKIELADAKKELDNSKETLDSAKAKLDDGYAELASSKRELDQAKAELDQAAKDIQDGQAKLTANQKLFNDKIADGEKKLADARAQLETGKTELAQARTQYQTGLTEFNTKIAAGQAELDNSKAQLDQAKAKLDAGWAEYNKNLKPINDKLEEINKQIVTIDSKIKSDNDRIAALDTGLAQLNTEINAFVSQIPAGMTKEIAPQQELTELVTIFEKLEKKQTKKTELTNQRATAIAGRQQLLEARTALLDEKAQVEAGKKQLESSKPALDKAQAQYDAGLKEYQEGLQKFNTEKAAGQRELDAAKAKIDSGQAKINQSQTQISQGTAELAAQKKTGQEQLNKARTDLQAGRDKYATGLSQYQDGVKKYQDGKATLDANKAKYDDGMAKYLDGKKKYDDGMADYLEGVKKYEDGLEKWQNGLADYNKGLQEYKDGQKTFTEEKAKADKKIADAEAEIKDVEEKLKDINIPSYKIQGIYGNEAFNSYISQISSLNIMSLIFTAMFYLVAILVTLTTVLRMVETERTQIGTLKALGYSKGKILRKFLMYGLLAALSGSIIGSLLGYYVLMPPIVRAYTSASNLDNITNLIDISRPIIIILASAIIIGLTIYTTLNKSLQEQPADLMRPKAPEKAKRTLFERIPAIWNKLSFLNKVSLRNLVKNKLRVLMIILGVAGSFGLIAMGFGIQDSVKNVGPRQFGQVYKYNAQLIFDDKADDYDKWSKDLDQAVEDKIAIIAEQGTITTPDGFNEDVSISATNETTRFLDFVELRKRSTEKNYQLEDNKVIISEKLAMTLDLSEGDTFKYIDSKGMEHSIEVQDITEQYFNHVVYMTKTTFNKKIDPDKDLNSYLVKFKDPSNEQVAQIKTDLSKYKANSAFVPVYSLEDTLNILSDSLNVIILMIIIVSALLTFVVLYNLTNINISERYKEISTIKVLGFRSNEVASYIFKENYILTLVGIIAGIFIAKLMHSIIVFSLSSDSFLFDPAMSPRSFIYAGVAVVAFMALVMVLAKKEMDEIHMIEALKDF